MNEPSNTHKTALCLSVTSYRYGNKGTEVTERKKGDKTIHIPTSTVEGVELHGLVHSPEQISEQIQILREKGIKPAMVHAHPLDEQFIPIPGWPSCDEQGNILEKGWYQKFADNMREIDPNMYITGASAMLHLEDFLGETKRKIFDLLADNKTALQGIVTDNTINQFVQTLKLPREQIIDCFKGVKFAHDKRASIRKISAPETGLTDEQLNAPLTREEVATLLSELLVRGQALWAGMDGLPIISVHSQQAHNRFMENGEKIVALPGAFSEGNLESMGHYLHDIYLSPVLAHLCYAKGLVPEVEIQHPSQISLVEGYQKAGLLKQPLNCGFVIGMAITNTEGNTGKYSGKKDYAGTVMDDVMTRLNPKSIRMVVVDRVNVPGDLEKSWELAHELREKYPNVIRGVDMGCEYATRFQDMTDCSNVELVTAAAKDIQRRANATEIGDALMSGQDYQEGFKQKKIGKFNHL